MHMHVVVVVVVVGLAFKCLLLAFVSNELRKTIFSSIFVIPKAATLIFYYHVRIIQ